MVKGNPHPNSGLTLVRRVKHCEGHMILTYFQARRLVLQFPGCWRKTGTSWVPNKGLHYSWHSRWRDLHLLIHFLCPPHVPPGQGRSRPKGMLRIQWACVIAVMSCYTLCDAIDCIARQALLSMGFSSHGYCIAEGLLILRTNLTRMLLANLQTLLWTEILLSSCTANKSSLCPAGRQSLSSKTVHLNIYFRIKAVIR